MAARRVSEIVLGYAARRRPVGSWSASRAVLKLKGLAPLVLLAVLVGGCATSSGGGPETSVAELTRLLVGEFNNHAQRWAARRTEQQPPPFFELVLQRLPGLAGHEGEALLLRQYDIEGRLYREARLLLKPADAGITQKVQVRRGDGWQTLDGCTVHWRRDDAAYRGATRGDGCRFEQRDSGDTVVFQRTWTAMPGRLTLQETERRVGGSLERSFQFARLRYYSGWAGVLAAGPASERGDDWRLDRQMRLHDGGGTARIQGESGDSGYAVRLERLLWPRSGTPMLRLSVLEAESGSLIAYSWAEPDAQQIGINLGWIQAGLQADADAKE